MPGNAASLTVLRSSPSPRARIVCFPYAGASVSSFHAWPALLGGDVEVAVVHLPGRYDRMGHEYRDGPRYQSVIKAAGPLADVIAPSTVPTVLFGHSVGALLAFEVARLLAADAVRLLAVSGCAAPHLVEAKDPIANLPDGEFLDRIRELGATPDEVFANPELISLVLPTLRADFAMAEEYLFQMAPPLTCPILILGGDADPYVDERGLRGWTEHTTSASTTWMVAGGHFFVDSQRRAVLARLKQAIHEACDGSAGPALANGPARCVVLTRGLPAAGKTTWSRAEVQRRDDRPIRISLDDLRAMFFDRRLSPEGEAFVAAARDALIRLAIEHDRDVIVDATNLDPAQEAGVRAVIDRSERIRLDIADFTPVPLETCVRRDQSRERPVGEGVIRDMYQRYIRAVR
jgi:medium-chain acyl-[acyl-carrier-protein] hydrolase